MVHAFACITHKGDQIVSGVAVNVLAAGLTVVAGVALFRRGGTTPSLAPDERFQPIHLPGAESLEFIPLIGPLWKELISGHPIIVYIAVAIPFLVWWMLSPQHVRPAPARGRRGP